MTPEERKERNERIEAQIHSEDMVQMERAWGKGEKNSRFPTRMQIMFWIVRAMMPYDPKYDARPPEERPHYALYTHERQTSETGVQFMADGRFPIARDALLRNTSKLTFYGNDKLLAGNFFSTSQIGQRFSSTGERIDLSAPKNEGDEPILLTPASGWKIDPKPFNDSVNRSLIIYPGNTPGQVALIKKYGKQFGELLGARENNVFVRLFSARNPHNRPFQSINNKSITTNLATFLELTKAAEQVHKYCVYESEKKNPFTEIEGVKMFNVNGYLWRADNLIRMNEDIEKGGHDKNALTLARKWALDALENAVKPVFPGNRPPKDQPLWKWVAYETKLFYPKDRPTKMEKTVVVKPNRNAYEARNVTNLIGTLKNNYRDSGREAPTSFEVEMQIGEGMRLSVPEKTFMHVLHDAESLIKFREASRAEAKTNEDKAGGDTPEGPKPRF